MSQSDQMFSLMVIKIFKIFKPGKTLRYLLIAVGKILNDSM